MRDKPALVILNVIPGLTQLNALVKKVMAQTGCDDPVEAIRLVNSGEWELVKAKILLPLGEVSVHAMDEFITAEKLVVGCGGEVPISYLGRNIKIHFLGKTEKNVPAVTLRKQELMKWSLDAQIRQELGVDKEEILLGQFWQYLKTADRAKWHVAYIKDCEGTLWAVSACWYGGGWRVGADSVEDQSGWRVGRMVVSR